ncbi:nickel ABC transporter permease [Alkalihalobacillus sp. NPDC078783]
MLTFIIRRLIQTIPVLLGVTIITFSLIHLIPGDPAQILAGEAASGDQVEQMRERLGLNESLPTQYFNYLKDVVTLDFGTSIRNGRPVGDEIGARFWVTVELALYSTIFSIILGMIAGIISATKRYSFADTGIMIIALFGLSMPNFWMGLMLIQYFSINLGWFASSGWGTWQQIVLPVVTLGTTGAAIIARMTRSSMLEVIGQDYIRTARAKGVKERYVIYQHALKNAMIPVVTVVGLQFGSLLGGTVLAESVFAINGMGRLIIDSIRSRDFPIVQGTVLVVSLLFVIVNLLVDIAYKVLNKRVDVD